VAVTARIVLTAFPVAAFTGPALTGLNVCTVPSSGRSVPHCIVRLNKDCRRAAHLTRVTCHMVTPVAEPLTGLEVTAGDFHLLAGFLLV
jgi:hypothetical protein